MICQVTFCWFRIIPAALCDVMQFRVFFFFLLLNLTSFFVVLFLLLAIYSCLSWSLDCLYFQFALAGNQCLHHGFAFPCMLVHSFYFLALVVPLFHLVCPISSLDFNLAVHLFGAVIR